MSLFVTYSEHTYCINEPDPPDVDWGQTGDYGLNVTLSGLYLSNPNPGYWPHVNEIEDGGYSDGFYGVDTFEKGEKAYIVVAEYTDGDTFGSSGYWCVPAIKRNLDDAVEIEELCGRDDREFSGYRPWDGYFAGLARVRIDIFEVFP